MRKEKTTVEQVRKAGLGKCRKHIWDSISGNSYKEIFTADAESIAFMFDVYRLHIENVE